VLLFDLQMLVMKLLFVSASSAASVAYTCRSGPVVVLNSINTMLATLNTDIDYLLGKASRELLLLLLLSSAGLAPWLSSTASTTHWPPSTQILVSCWARPAVSNCCCCLHLQVWPHGCT
jgi:hypothetical protein